MASHLLGSLGHVFAKLEILHVLRIYLQSYLSPPMHDGKLRSALMFWSEADDCSGIVRASVELAHEYTRLGKTSRAQSIYAELLPNVLSDASGDVQVLCLLRYAELLASVGNIGKR